jgi:hypothetical protein
MLNREVRQHEGSILQCLLEMLVPRDGLSIQAVKLLLEIGWTSTYQQPEEGMLDDEEISAAYQELLRVVQLSRSGE